MEVESTENAEKHLPPLVPNEGVDERYRDPMAKVFEQPQEDLLALDREWSANNIQKDYNDNYVRAAPSDLRTGPGY